MTPTYRYSHASKTLTEVASMVKPDVLDGAYFWMEYNAHLSTLKQYPTTGFSETDDGKEFGEGEFELRYEIDLKGEGSYDETNKEDYNSFPGYKRIIALPTSQPAQGEKEGTQIIHNMKAFGYELVFIKNPMMKEGQVMASPELLEKLKDVFSHLPSFPLPSDKQVEGLRWVKASERLPEKYGSFICRLIATRAVTVVDFLVGRRFDTDYPPNAFEWLDENINFVSK